MTGSLGDWTHLTGAPSDRQLAAARDLYRHAAATPTLAAMNVELRHPYDRSARVQSWQLELVGERDGQQVVGFSEDIDAAPGREREAAEVRLVLAGQPGPWVWTKVDGGWDGKRTASPPSP